MSEPLTVRQIVVLRHMADGLTAEESAKELGLAHRTVISHRNMLRVSLGAKNAPNAVKLGYELGYLGGGVA